jgi:S-adenosylmethionine synthetase
MFGYATNETENTLALDLSHIITQEAILRRENNEITYLRPDASNFRI